MKGKRPKKRRYSAYFDPANMMAVEDERLRRIAKGTPRSQASLSALINEAIEQAYSRKRG